MGAGRRSRRWWRVAMAGVAAALAGVVGPGVADAGSGPSLTLAPPTAEPGATVEASGSGVPGGNLVVLFLDDAPAGTELSSTTATGSGTFSTSFTVPGVAAGDHVVLGCFGRSRQSLVCNQMRAVLDVTPRRSTTTTTTERRPTTTAVAPSTSTTTTATAPTATSTTMPGVAVTTTLGPTTTTTPADVGVLATSTTLPTPGQLGVTTTTLGGDPPFEPQLPLAATTTLTLPGQLQGQTVDDIANLAITHVEVTQGLQNLANQFPLVRHRPTAIRIHGTSESTGPVGQTGVMAAVEGVRGGESLGVVYAENAPVHFDGDLHRGSNDHVPYVRIPNTWTTGTVTLRAWVWAIDPTAANEPTASDNLGEVTVTFHPASDLPELWYFPLYLTEDFEPEGAPMIHTAEDGWLLQHITATRLLPVPSLVGHPQSTVIGFPWTGWNLHPDAEVYGEPLVALAQLHELNGAGPRDMYVGMVDPDLDTGWIAGLASGSAPVQWTKMADGFDQTSPWRQAGGETLAHEVGHLQGLDHAPCKYEVLDPTPGEEKGGPWDVGFPAAYGWPDCSLAPTDVEGFYGFEVLWEISASEEPAILTNSNASDPPQLAFPWMGYRNPGWLDPWHGCHVADAFGVPCVQTDLVSMPPDAPNGGAVPQGGNPDPSGVPAFDCHDPLTDVDLCQFLPPGTNDPIPAGADGTLAVVPPPGWDESLGRMVVSGWVEPGTPDRPAAGSLDAVVRLPGDQLPDRFRLDGDPTGGGPFVVAAVDGAGVAQWITTLDVEAPSAHGEFGDSDGGLATAVAQPFAVSVPNLPGIERVVLASPSGTLAELAAGGAPPLVGLDGVDVAGELTVRFRAEDPDGGAVDAILQWRADAEERWQTIGVGLRGPEARVPLRDLVGGDGVLRLVATDGFHSSVAELGGITVPAQPPTVSILSPLDGAVLRAGRNVDLRGQAVLPGGVEVTGDALVWSSSVHGVLGTGASLSVDRLAEGLHQLRLTATGPTGTTASTTITVEIGESDLPPAEVRAVVQAAFAGVPAGADVPPRGGGLPWAIVGAGALALGGAGAVIGSRRGRLGVRRR